MPKVSAGILLYLRRAGVLEVLLVHPGGPFYANKDKGVWGIPKGEIDAATGERCRSSWHWRRKRLEEGSA